MTRYRNSIETTEVWTNVTRDELDQILDILDVDITATEIKIVPEGGHGERLVAVAYVQHVKTK